MAIQIKRSAVNSSTTLPGSLASGELAVVQAAKKLFIGRHNNSEVEVFHLSTLNDITGGNGITSTVPVASNDNSSTLAVDITDSTIFGTTAAKGLLQADSDVFQVTSGVVDVKDNGIDNTHIDWGTGSGQVSSADVVEETNLYHTTARARGAFSNGTGVVITNGSVAIGQSVATDQTPQFAGMNIDGNATVTGNITFDAGSGNSTIASTNGNVLVEGTEFVGNDVTIAGNLTVEGATTTVKSNTVVIDDPIFLLGAVSGAAPSSDDNKDRGILAHYYSGSAKQAFFGLDDSSGRFTFIPDATELSGVISGSAGHAQFSEVTATTFHGTLDGGTF